MRQAIVNVCIELTVAALIGVAFTLVFVGCGELCDAGPPAAALECPAAVADWRDHAWVHARGTLTVQSNRNGTVLFWLMSGKKRMLLHVPPKRLSSVVALVGKRVEISSDYDPTESAMQVDGIREE